MTWKKDTNTSSYTLPIASSTVLGGVKVGSGLSISTGGVLSATGTSTGGSGLTYKGLLSDFVSLTDNYSGYFNGNLQDGIYLIPKDNRPPDSNPPIHSTEDIYLIHQKMPKDGFNWAFQEAFSATNIQVRYKRKVLQGSSKTDGRQQQWEFAGTDYGLTKTSRMRLLTLGDSITAKWAGDPLDATNPSSVEPWQPHMNTQYPGQTMDNRPGYQTEIYRRLRTDVWSLGRGGARMADNVGQEMHDFYSFSRLAQAMDFTAFDVVTVSYGTNDVAWQVSLGTIDSTDVSTFIGSMNVGIEAIYANNPNIQIFFITPPPRLDGANNNATVGDWDSNQAATLPYTEKIIEICNKWNLPYFDSVKNGGVNKYNWSKYMNVDKLHYDDYSLWGGRLAEKLKQYIV
jgi:lysophospholipase L1-like esterase